MKCYYVVGRYQEVGNMAGKYKDEVLKGDFKKSSICDGEKIKKEILGQGDNAEESEQNKDTNDENKDASKDGEKDQSQEAFAKDALNAHNALRAIHNAPAMKLNDKMNKDATEYAKELAKLGTIEHSSPDKRDNAGENLAYQCSGGPINYVGSNPVAAWYSEICKPGYDFNEGKFSGGTGHFTQIAWKGSTELGMGFATGKKDKMTCYYAVGRYKEAGNMQGDFKKNVLKGQFNKASICNGAEVKPEILNAGSTKRHSIRKGDKRSIGTSLLNGKEIKKTYIPEGEKRWLRMMRKSHKHE